MWDSEGIRFSRNHPFPVFIDKLKTNTDFPDRVLSFPVNCLQVVESFLGGHRKPAWELIKTSTGLVQIQVHLRFQAQSSLGCLFYLVVTTKGVTSDLIPCSVSAERFLSLKLTVGKLGLHRSESAVSTLFHAGGDPGRRCCVAVTDLPCLFHLHRHHAQGGGYPALPSEPSQWRWVGSASSWDPLTPRIHPWATELFAGIACNFPCD